jgi:hypothetical protein
MLNKALEMGVCFNRGPALGETGRDAPFLRPLREGIISLFREISTRNLRDMYKGPADGQLSPYGPCWETWR